MQESHYELNVNSIKSHADLNQNNFLDYIKGKSVYFKEIKKNCYRFVTKNNEQFNININPDEITLSLNTVSKKPSLTITDTNLSATFEILNFIGETQSDMITKKYIQRELVRLEMLENDDPELILSLNFKGRERLNKFKKSWDKQPQSIKNFWLS